VNYIDIILGGLISYGAIKGFSKGLIIEAASIVALILGIIGALVFSQEVQLVLEKSLNENSTPPAGITFLLLFVFIIIGVNLIAKFLTRIINMAALGGLNRILGAVLGGLKFALAISAIFLVIDKFSFVMNYFDSEVINESTLFKPVKSVGERVFDWLIDQKEFLPNQLV